MRRSGSRSIVALTLLSCGSFTALPNRRLNLSPQYPASSIDVGTGSSPGASIVLMRDIRLAVQFDLTGEAVGRFFGEIVHPETELNRVTIIR